MHQNRRRSLWVVAILLTVFGIAAAGCSSGTDSTSSDETTTTTSSSEDSDSSDGNVSSSECDEAIATFLDAWYAAVGVDPNNPPTTVDAAKSASAIEKTGAQALAATQACGGGLEYAEAVRRYAEEKGWPVPGTL